MKIKTVQGPDDSLGVAERRVISTELLSLISQIDLNVTQAIWNGKTLLSGETSPDDTWLAFNFQIGAGNSSINDTLKFNLLNWLNVPFSSDNSGFTAYRLNVTNAGINLSENFDRAGFRYPPKGSITINGEVFNLSNYPTVQSFMDAINFNTVIQADITYDSINDRFVLSNQDTVSNMTISETGTEFVSGEGNEITNGFLAQLSIDIGIFNGLTRSKTINPEGFIASSNGAYNHNIHITSGSAPLLMRKIDNAINDVSAALSYTGSITNRLTYQEKSLNTSKINTDAARSRIEDADMASEQLQATKLQILQQTASTMLAQANTSPQAILSLFK